MCELYLMLDLPLMQIHFSNVFFFAAGLQTSQDARFYASSYRFDDFSNQDEPLVIQFTVKHEQSIDCGGGYIETVPLKPQPGGHARRLRLQHHVR